MSLLMIGLIVTVSLVIVPLVVLNIVEYMRNRRDGVRVMAIVIDVQVKKDWRDGEGWYRDAWRGDLQRQKTWQTYYDVTAQWVHPQTGHTYIASTRIWSDDSTSKPVEGDSGTVWFDPHNPEQSYLDLQGLENEAQTPVGVIFWLSCFTQQLIQLHCFLVQQLSSAGLLGSLAHNVVIWARWWLTEAVAPSKLRHLWHPSSSIRCGCCWHPPTSPLIRAKLRYIAIMKVRNPKAQILIVLTVINRS